jgi:hypothetical protein
MSVAWLVVCMKTTTVALSVEFAYVLRVYAAQARSTISAVVERAVREYMLAHPVA